MSGDQQYPKVSLLLRGDGSDQSFYFRDYSLFARTITRTGAVVISTTSPKIGSGSIYSPGSSGVFLNLPPEAFNFGIEDFTIEFWCNLLTNVTAGGYPYIMSTSPYNSGAGFYIVADGSNTGWGGIGKISFVGATTLANAPNVTSGSVAIRNAGWKHIAIVRQSLTTNLFVDGTIVGTHIAAGIANYTPTNARLFSASGDDNSNDKGYIDELRVTIGLARYTSTFTPSIVEFPNYASEIAGTIRDRNGFLAERSVKVYQRSTGTLLSKMLTQEGDANIGNVSLLLHGELVGSTYSIVDSSVNSHAISSIGYPQISTTVGILGSTSLQLNGVQDALSINHDTTLNLASGDFTIESWINVKSLATRRTILQKDQSYGTTYTSYSFAVETNGQLLAAVGTGASATYSQSISSAVGSILVNTWYHVAFVRYGTLLKLFINGVEVASATQTGTPVDGGKPLIIGRYPNGGGSADMWWHGYLRDLRITKGIARYTSGFSAPSKRFPDNSLSLGYYYAKLPTLEEVNVVASDDDGDIFENDKIIRVIPS